MGRAPCCDKANVKRGPWSPEEDDKLKSYIHNHGTGGNWISLPQKIGLKRCGKSCRLRWLNYLRPNIKHGGFTEDEDDLICSLYISIGSRWSIIAAQLPGRTDNDIKNYWNTRLKKKLLGRQRREQLQARRETKQNNNWPPQQVAAPPFQQAAVYSNITIDIPSTQNNNVGNFCYRTCWDDNIVSFLQNPKNPMTSDFHGIGGILPNNDFQAYDHNEINVISENIFSSSYSMPGHQQLDRILDSTFPAESAISCGDISCLVYPSYYEDVLQTKSHESENCLFF